MCLLTVFPNGVLPDVEALLRGAEFNADGHGWAIAAGDQLLTGHSMDDCAAIEAFAKARYDNPDGPALFHSRFTTDGSTTLDNCHPFYVGGDRRTVLAHNGILPKNVRPRGADKRSDTRIAAEGYIPSLGSLRYRTTRDRVERWMGSYNKIAILTVNPKYRDQLYILNERAGIWDGGIWYSNDAYQPYVPKCMVRGGFTVVGGSKGGWDTPREFTEWPTDCMICEALIEPSADYCDYCNACQMCYSDRGDCMCYVPMALAKKSSDDEPIWENDPHRVQVLGWPGAGD